MEALGLNIFNIVIYVVLFTILYLVLNKFLIGKMIVMLEKRQQALIDAEAQKVKLGEQEVELKEKIAEVKEDLRKENKIAYDKVIDEARADKQEILAQARVEAEGIKEAAGKQLAIEKEKIEEEMSANVSVAVQKVMEQIYQGRKQEIDQNLIQKALKELS